MAGTGINQHRGSATPDANQLWTAIHTLQTCLGMQGNGNVNAFFTVIDANGTPRARIGALLNGDFGIVVQDAVPNAQELIPLVSSSYDGEQFSPFQPLTTTSSTFGTLSDNISCEVDIGSSGDALITISAGINVATAGTFGKIGLSVNGSTPVYPWLAGSDGAAGFYQHCSATKQYTQVIADTAKNYNEALTGINTFSLMYAGSTNGDTYNFEHVSLTVQPI